MLPSVTGEHMRGDQGLDAVAEEVLGAIEAVAVQCVVVRAGGGGAGECHVGGGGFKGGQGKPFKLSSSLRVALHFLRVVTLLSFSFSCARIRSMGCQVQS